MCGKTRDANFGCHEECKDALEKFQDGLGDCGLWTPSTREAAIACARSEESRLLVMVEVIATKMAIRGFVLGVIVSSAGWIILRAF